MFDIGWTELLVVGVVALIVVGPKDLPGMFRTLGRFTGRMKGMAREFQRAMHDAADESGIKDIAGDLKKVASPRSMGLDKLNEAANKFESWKPGDSGGKKGPETQKLSEERAAVAKKIHDVSAKRATEKSATEAAAKAVAEASPAASKPKPAATPRAAAKPKATTKPKAAPKPKAVAKPKAAAKPKAKPAKAGDSKA